jgi:beta-1,4-N-acetylglucosaminyltransferase
VSVVDLALGPLSVPALRRDFNHQTLLPMSSPRSIFVTVGSTHFDELVEAVLSAEVLQAIRRRGFSRLIVQTGKYKIPGVREIDGQWRWESGGLKIEAWSYKEGIASVIDEADWVISHAGA